MKYTLRDYQDGDVNNLRAAFKAGYQAPLYVLPTAGGKTIVFCHIAEAAERRGNKILILVHRKELLEQASDKLSEIGVEHGLIASGRTMTKEKIQVASVDTLIRRLPQVQRPDLIIVDEAHHCVPGNKWGKTAAFFNCRLLGVTATPIRFQGRGLGKSVGGFFDILIKGPSIQELIDSKYLSQPVTYAPPCQVDLKGLRTQAGDWIKNELSLRVDKTKITGDAVEHYKRICPGVPAIAFCVSIMHAEHVAQQFNAGGVRAASIDGNMSNRQREDRIQALASGRIKVLTSCEIISEGTDIPVVTASIGLRPTKSLGLYIQQSGRVLRIHPEKKQSYILDHVNNVQRFGLIDEVRNWTLEAVPNEEKDGEPVARVRQCQICFAVFPIFKSVCPQCGSSIIKKERDIETEAGELEKVDPAKIQAERESRDKRMEQSAAGDLATLQRLEKKRKYKPGWANHIWSARLKKRYRVAS